MTRRNAGFVQTSDLVMYTAMIAIPAAALYMMSGTTTISKALVGGLVAASFFGMFAAILGLPNDSTREVGGLGCWVVCLLVIGVALGGAATGRFAIGHPWGPVAGSFLGVVLLSAAGFALRGTFSRGNGEQAADRGGGRGASGGNE